MVATIRSYETMLANFMHYREIEKRVVELEAKYARLAREKARAMRPSEFLHSWFRLQESSAAQIQAFLTQAPFLESLALIMMLGS